MPIQDSLARLRTVSDGLLDGVETLTAIDIGPSPAEGALLAIYMPLDATTFTAKLEDSPDNSNWTDVPQAVWTETVGAQTLYKRIFWTQRYLRWQVTAATGSFGNVVVSIERGQIPNS